MLERVTRTGPWVGCVGALVLLLGLAWDAALHRADPSLAAREGVLTLANPGHQLFVAGVVLTSTGALLFLLGAFARVRRSSAPQRIVSALGIAAVVGLLGLTFAISAPSAIGLATGQHHDHDQAVQALVDHAGAMGSSLGAGRGVHVHGDPAAATDADRAGAQRLLDDTRAGTARFADFGVAVAEGYRQVTPYRAGGVGPAHYLNPRYNRDGKLLDPSQPEGLVYLRTRDGTMTLLGALFMAPVGQGPTPGGPLTIWHMHPDLLPPGAPEMLHVWLFDHPGGPFAHSLTSEALRVVWADAGADATAGRKPFDRRRLTPNAPGGSSPGAGTP